MTTHQSRCEGLAAEIESDDGILWTLSTENVALVVSALRSFASQPAGGAPDGVSAAEFLSRNMWPKMWAKIDDNAADDDWHGGTALNARKSLLRAAQELVDTILEKSQPAGGAVGELLANLSEIADVMKDNSSAVWTASAIKTIEDAYKFVRTAAPSPNGGGWMPIEMAPKDGTEILLFGPCRDLEYHNQYAPGLHVGWWSVDHWATRDIETECLPVSWQPLPQPPQVQS